MTNIVLIDNHDSFVYNLLDAFAVAGYKCTVFRNTVSVETVLSAKPDLICLSPGPGYPREAGTMMELIDATLGRIPLLGICLGYQAIMEHCGATVEPCGPVHGTTDIMTINDAGLASTIFSGLTLDAQPTNPSEPGREVAIARYHSLGSIHAPEGIVPLATCSSDIGPVIMAAMTTDNMAIGLQFHPESILSPSGPIILSRCVEKLLEAHEHQLMGHL